MRFTKKENISPDSEFKNTVEKILENGGSGTYHLCRKREYGGHKSRTIVEGEVKDLRDTDPGHWIMTAFGGGDYALRLDKTGDKGMEEIVKTYYYYIDGEPKETRYETTKRKEKETANMIEIFKISMDCAENLKSDYPSLAAIFAIMQESSKQSNAVFAQTFEQMIEMQKKAMKI